MTITYRYLKWDGIQGEFKLEAQDLFHEFSNFLMEGWTTDEAFEWIMKQGIRGGNIRVMGIDELRSEIGRIKNPHLKDLLNAFSDDPEFMALFKKAPAAKGVHHVYIGGLLEHTLELVTLCRDIIRHYPDADADLLVTGAILHDAGKVYELGYKKSIDYTDEGRLIGHILLGFKLVEEKIRKLNGFPKDLAMLLEHIIISHQGRYEWGSPKRPKTLEALILHYLDEMNAKIKSFKETFEKGKNDTENAEDQTGWSSYNRIFERFLYNRRYRGE